jgi:hypothetical protein
MSARPRRPAGRFLAPNGRTTTKPLRELPQVADEPEQVDRIREARNIRDEPECIGPAWLEDWEQVRQLHRSQQHIKDVIDMQDIRPTLSIEDRVRDIQRRAKHGGYDLRRETALMLRDIERANAGGRRAPARVYERAEGLEALLDGVTVARAA